MQLLLFSFITLTPLLFLDLFVWHKPTLLSSWIRHRIPGSAQSKKVDCSNRRKPAN